MSAELSAQTVYHAWNRCCKGTGLYHCAMAWQQQGVGVVLIEGRHGMAKPAAGPRGPTLQVRIVSVALDTVSINKLERLCAPMLSVRQGMRVRCSQPLCMGPVTGANL